MRKKKRRVFTINAPDEQRMVDIDTFRVKDRLDLVRIGHVFE